MRILIIDPMFTGSADIEVDAAGPDMTLDFVRTDHVPDAAAGRADAVITCRSLRPIAAPLIERFERAKVLVQAGVGTNHIDVDACARRGIAVCNTPHYGTREVADHAIALTLALARGITAYNNRLLLRGDGWQTPPHPFPPVRRLSGQVFGVVGLGRIGTATALRAGAFGMTVGFHDPHLPTGHELALGLRRFATRDELLAAADIVSLHCPLDAGTAGMIDGAAVARMKPGAILVNTGRGGVVDLDAVEHGLRTNQLRAAGLDVLPVEPLDGGHPLIAAWRAGEPWLEGRLILTPHAAFYTPESLADMRRLSVATAVDVLRTGRLRDCVNRPDLERYGAGRLGR